MNKKNTKKIFICFRAAVSAWQSLKINRLRSLLTVSGIVIGIASLIIVFASGEGIRGLILGQLDSWGSDSVQIEYKVPSTVKDSADSAMTAALGNHEITLKLADGEAIAKQPNISAMYAALFGQSIVNTPLKAEIYSWWAVTASFLKIDSGKVAVGRFFTAEEDKSLAKVAVLGFEAKDKFFGSGDAVGQYLKIGKHNFKVIGVMEKRGSVMFMNMDELIFLPLETGQKLLAGVDHVSFVTAKMTNKDLGVVTADELTFLLRERHNITDPVKDDFVVHTMAEAKDMINTVLGGVTLLLAAIAAVSLLVGGVGIMNIMLISVTERTYEIGLRKAIGASRRDILIQFLLEALVLTGVGGIIGTILGALVSFLISIIAQAQGFDWPFVLKSSAWISAAGVSMAIGLIFGMYPALKASKLDPIEALRKE